MVWRSALQPRKPDNTRQWQGNGGQRNGGDDGWNLVTEFNAPTARAVEVNGAESVTLFGNSASKLARQQPLVAKASWGLPMPSAPPTATVR
jgi:hypothetical protein